MLELIKSRSSLCIIKSIFAIKKILESSISDFFSD